MSGFAVIFQDPNRVELDMMIRAIHHRGPYVFGKYENEDIGMAQNYLKGDVDGRTIERLHEGTASIPVYYTDKSENLIGYDGHVGNQKSLGKA